MKFLLSCLFVFSFGVVPAFAHWGHIGEVAGHGHLVGVAAIAGAVAIGLIAKGRDAAKQPESEDTEPETGDAEGEAA